VDGNGRGCNTLTGSFTISNVVFGPFGYVQTLDATFEQHCEGSEPALRGEVHIANPAPPPALELALAIAVDGTVSTLNGKATVGGTVTCGGPVNVGVGATVTQVVKRTLVTGSAGVSVDCTPGAPVPWRVTVTPNGTTPFQKGDVEVQAFASAVDPNYGQFVTVTETAAVRLTKA
jgi:hypothetical protein